MKRWHVTVNTKELECVLSRAYPDFNKLILIADEKTFAVEFNSLDDFTNAKNGGLSQVTVQSLNKRQTLSGHATFKEIK